MKDQEETDEYRHKQAVECHSAALSSKSAETRQAFLELEQGWLQLISDTETAAAGPDTDRATRRKAPQRSRRRPRKRGVSFLMTG